MHDGAIEHALPGRVRLRFRSRRGDRKFFEDVARVLREDPIVRGVDANPLTGGVLIRYAGRPEQFAELAHRHGIPLKHAAATARKLPKLSAGRSIPVSSVALGLLALGQLARGRLAGSAGEQFWQAHALQQLQAPGFVPAALIGVGLIQLMMGRILPPASSLIAYALVLRYRRGA